MFILMLGIMKHIKVRSEAPYEKIRFKVFATKIYSVNITNLLTAILLY